MVKYINTVRDLRQELSRQPVDYDAYEMDYDELLEYATGCVLEQIREQGFNWGDNLDDYHWNFYEHLEEC